MKLTAFLTLTGMTPAAFSRRIGVTKQATFKYVHGLRIPAPSVMLRIREATDGQVTADDFIDQLEEAERTVSSRRGNARSPVAVGPRGASAPAPGRAA